MLSLLYTFSQNSNFETGAQWYYNIQQDYTNKNYGYKHFEVAGDTIINETICKVINQIDYRYSGETIHYEPHIFRITNGMIEYLNNEQFTTIYNFDLNEGDTLINALYNYQQCDSLSPLIIDSVKTMVHNGVELKKQFASQIVYYNQFEVGYLNEKIQYTFIEKIGNIEQLIFQPRCDVADNWGAVQSLRCYIDDEIHFRNNWWGYDECDAIVTTSKNIETSFKIRVYPTCTENYLYLTANDQIPFNAKIIDMNGYILQKFSSFLPEKLDISTLKKGAYIIQILTQTNAYAFKIYKL